MELILKDEVYAIVGAAIEVHRVLGSGFLEPVYQEAMDIESTTRQLPYKAQPILKIRYKEHTLKKEYKPDFIFYDHYCGDQGSGQIEWQRRSPNLELSKGHWL